VSRVEFNAPPDTI